MRAAVELTGAPPCLSLKVNGEPVYATAVEIYADARSIPKVVVQLDVVDPMVVGLEAAEVCILDHTRKSLLALGWTPPEGTEDAQEPAGLPAVDHQG